MTSPLIHTYAAYLYQVGQNTNKALTWYEAYPRQHKHTKTIQNRLISFKYLLEVIREEFSRVCEQD
uniref:Uncharacterized protein n=1 Tax=viral metagenome TaxID=1070528 RepID=A0A6M3LK63_9ZZZZ